MGDFRSKKKSDETMQNKIDAIEDEYDIGKEVKPSNLPPIKPPEMADPERKTNIPKPESHPSAEDAETMEIVRKRLRDTEIKPYVEPPFDVNDDPRLKSLWSRIESMNSQIAGFVIPRGGRWFDEYGSGKHLHTLDETRKEQAEAQLARLRERKDDLEMQYEREQEKISIAHAAEHEQNAKEHYQKEVERVGGTPEQRKRLKRNLGIEYDEEENKISGEEDPIKALKLRFAKGEITKEEFLEMKKILE